MIAIKNCKNKQLAGLQLKHSKITMLQIFHKINYNLLVPFTCHIYMLILTVHSQCEEDENKHLYQHVQNKNKIRDGRKEISQRNNTMLLNSNIPYD